MATRNFILTSSAEIGGAGSLFTLGSLAEIAGTGALTLDSAAEIAPGLILFSSAEVTAAGAFTLASSAYIRDIFTSFDLSSSAEIKGPSVFTLSSSASIAGATTGGGSAADTVLYQVKEGRPFNRATQAVEFLDFVDQGATPAIRRLTLQNGVITLDASPRSTGIERIWLRDTATSTPWKLYVKDFTDTIDTGDPGSEIVYNRLTLQDQVVAAKYNLVVTNGVLMVTSTVIASLWNSTEDPSLPMDTDSLAAQVCERHILTECKNCVSGTEFAMASTGDLTIKKFTPDVHERSVYVFARDAAYYPVDEPVFPNTSLGCYETTGFPTLIQSECSKLGSQSDKFFTGINVEMDVKAATIPGKLYAQAGCSNSPHCLDWFSAKPKTMDCNRGAATDEMDTGLRPARPTSFSYYRVGNWLAWRLFVADGETDGDYAPIGAAASFNKITLAVKVKNETWHNQ